MRSQYANYVQLGRKRMATRRVVIAGLARDIGYLARVTCQRIEELGAMFRDYRVVLFENDSRDQTRSILKAWSQKNRRFHLLTENCNDPVHPISRCLKRVERMAYYRNEYRQYTMENLSDFDDVVVVDTDLVGGWSHDGLANSYGHSGYDAVGSYGIIYKRDKLRWNRFVHYDAWAFRHHGDDRPLITREVNEMAWNRGDPMVPVFSCFGGMGVYRMEAFLAGRYAGGDCEHVSFHRTLRDSGFERCFLNPSQICVYGRHHRSMDPALRAGFRMLHACGLVHSPQWVFEDEGPVRPCISDARQPAAPLKMTTRRDVA